MRVTSLSDTARSNVRASFTADRDVPPRSKKWSSRPIWSWGMPSTVLQAAASRSSVGVPGASWFSATTASSAASAVSFFLSILLLAVSGRLSRQWKTAGTMYSGSDRPSPSCSRSTPSGCRLE